MEHELKGSSSEKSDTFLFLAICSAPNYWDQKWNKFYSHFANVLAKRAILEAVC